MVYKILHDMAPKKLKKLFTRVDMVSSKETRVSIGLFYIKKTLIGANQEGFCLSSGISMGFTHPRSHGSTTLFCFKTLLNHFLGTAQIVQ